MIADRGNWPSAVATVLGDKDARVGEQAGGGVVVPKYFDSYT
jgi:hypothetical protein